MYMYTNWNIDQEQFHYIDALFCNNSLCNLA